MYTDHIRPYNLYLYLYEIDGQPSYRSILRQLSHLNTKFRKNTKKAVRVRDSVETPKLPTPPP